MTFHPFAPTSGMFDRVVASTKPISLEKMNAEASLMTRLDQEYFVPRAVLGELLARYSGLRILALGSERVPDYPSTYIDTSDFRLVPAPVPDRTPRTQA